MSQQVAKSKIALIGPYLPPYGGIAIHIQRLKEQLEKQGHDCIVYALGRETGSSEKNVIRIKNTKEGLGWLARYFFFAKEDIIHFHSPDWRMRVIMGLMGLLGKKTVISIHGESLNDSLKAGSWFRKRIIKSALKLTSFIITANESIKCLVLSLGVEEQKVDCVPAFIPPAVKEEEIAEIPQEVWNFIANHTPVVSANAFRIILSDGQDRYGADMCIDLCANLKGAYPEVGFVFCLPDIGNYDYFFKLKQRIAEKNIENNFLFVTEPYQYYPILTKSNIFVRPTNTDGDAVSLREALFFKIPSVTSDAVIRPDGAILFKNRDINDFTLKVREVLDNYEWHKKNLDTVKLEDNFEKIMGIYQRLTSD